MRTSRFVHLLLPLVLASSSAGLASAGEATATLHLDADSHISFSATETLRVPAGSAIRFRFGAPRADGSLPITVHPEDVAIAPIPVAQGAALAYTLAAPATGTLRASARGAEIELDATLVATLRGRPEVPPVAYALRFTTGTARAENAERSDSVAVDGMPAGAANAVRLVGAATNGPAAYPGAGAAVYAILSGRFDGLPVLR